MQDNKKISKEVNTKFVLSIKLAIMPSIFVVHCQWENMMVFNVACVITSYLLMVSTIWSNLQLFAYL
jgi:uncharacterized membrane protein YbaN (DUF454 family)